LQHHAPPEWGIRTYLPTHVGYSALADEYRKLPAAVFVRNPWDWYVNYYEFARGHPDLRKLREWAALPFVDALPRMEAFTVHFGRLTRGAETVLLGRFEDIREELLRILREVGYDPPEHLTEATRVLWPCNGSKRRRYRDYYGDAERELVADQDSAIIKRCGYEF
jgi:hypothetical protein